MAYMASRSLEEDSLSGSLQSLKDPFQGNERPNAIENPANEPDHPNVLIHEEERVNVQNLNDRPAVVQRSILTSTSTAISWVISCAIIILVASLLCSKYEEVDWLEGEFEKKKAELDEQMKELRVSQELRDSLHELVEFQEQEIKNLSENITKLTYELRLKEKELLLLETTHNETKKDCSDRVQTLVSAKEQQDLACQKQQNQAQSRYATCQVSTKDCLEKLSQTESHGSRLSTLLYVIGACAVVILLIGIVLPKNRQSTKGL